MMKVEMREGLKGCNGEWRSYCQLDGGDSLLLPCNSEASGSIEGCVIENTEKRCSCAFLLWCDVSIVMPRFSREEGFSYSCDFQYRPLSPLKNPTFTQVLNKQSLRKAER